jgi:hypothetical protein
MNLIIDNKKHLAFQNNRKLTVRYDQAYFEKYIGYKDKNIDINITKGRITIVNRYTTSYNLILDIGCGICQFINKLDEGNEIKRCYGYDVIPETVSILKDKHLFFNIEKEDFKNFACITMWDVFEHLPEPEIILDKVKKYSYVIMSIPIFKNFENIRKNKHYRPYEHYWYFTDKGLKKYMKEAGFQFIEKRDFEIKAGRKDIYTYVFLKN